MQIGDTFFDGNPSEDTFVKAGPNEAGALKNFITVGDSDWYFKIYQSPYQNRNTYRIDYVGTTTQDNP